MLLTTYCVVFQECTKVFTNLVQVVLNEGKLGDSSLKNCLIKFDCINTLVLILNLRVKSLASSDLFLNLTGVVKVLNVHRKYESEHYGNYLKVLQYKFFELFHSLFH